MPIKKVGKKYQVKYGGKTKTATSCASASAAKRRMTKKKK